MPNSSNVTAAALPALGLCAVSHASNEVFMCSDDFALQKRTFREHVGFELSLKLWRQALDRMQPGNVIEFVQSIVNGDDMGSGSQSVRISLRPCDPAVNKHPGFSIYFYYIAQVDQDPKLSEGQPDVGCGFYFDIKAGIFHATDTMARHLGYSGASEIPLELEKLTNFIHPDDFKSLMEVITDFGEDSMADFEFRMLQKSGEYRWLAARPTHVVNNPETGELKISGVHFDIHERKILEQNLRREKMALESLIENAPFGLFKNTKDGQCVYANHAYQQLTGLSMEEALGLGWQQLFNQDVASFLEKKWSSASSNIGFCGCYAVTTKDGTRKWLQVYWTGADSMADEQLAMGLVIDATQEVEANLQLEQKAIELQEALDQAERATRFKSQFLAMITHELRTPLNGILGMASLMNEQTMTADDANMLQIIRSCGSSLLGLINDVLEYSKIEAGSLELHKQFISVNELIHSTVNMFTVAMSQKQLDFHLSVGQLPAYFYADETKLRRILMNLLGNAIKVCR